MINPIRTCQQCSHHCSSCQARACMGAFAYLRATHRSDPQWMRVERSTLPDGLPWPDDSIQMAITQHDRGRVQTFDARFEPPCLSRWETGPFKVRLHCRSAYACLQIALLACGDSEISDCRANFAPFCCTARKKVFLQAHMHSES